MLGNRELGKSNIAGQYTHWLDAMAGILTTIIHWATPPIVIDMNAKAVAFRCRDHIETVEPILWISGEGRGAALVAVGANPVLTQSAERVDLFSPEWLRRPDQERVELVDAFCRYGMAKVMVRWRGFPTVRVRGLSTVADTQQATIREALGRALEMPNAWEVIWQDDNDV